MYTAYLITNTVNGKRYVGMTKHTYSERFHGHWTEAKSEYNNKSLPSSMLHREMIEYGIESFQVYPIEEGISEDDHQEKERIYIDKFDTYYLNNPLGYNMTIGGNGTIGYVFTECDKSKMSSIHKGCTFSKERNERLREIMTGRQYKQEWKDALSASRIGRFKGDENPFYGKHHSLETKQIIRENNSGDLVEQLDDDGNVLNEFFNLADAGRWVSANVSTAKATTCSTRIREVCVSNNPKCTAYGYHWRLKERSID